MAFIITHTKSPPWASPPWAKRGMNFAKRPCKISKTVGHTPARTDMLRNFVTASPGGLKGGVPRIRCASNAAFSFLAAMVQERMRPGGGNGGARPAQTRDAQRACISRMYQTCSSKPMKAIPGAEGAQVPSHRGASFNTTSRKVGSSGSRARSLLYPVHHTMTSAGITSPPSKRAWPPLQASRRPQCTITRPEAQSSCRRQTRVWMCTPSM
mmetsp:Transcript_66242/g.146717  ORF Transcript_66242/g.146717 Transcript_66242/m.146717 type:complete len:211 (-) Transcript_66242:410-1042(-)